MDHLITARDIIKDFPSGDGKIRVLHGIDLDLNAGELTMMVGPSGCGKTTLLSILTGILTPSGGEVEVAGAPLFRMSDDELVDFRRCNLGFIFQQFNLLPSLTAAENAAIPLVAGGMSMRAAMRKSSAVLARIGMADHLAKLPAHLSGGQQQRVAIARALVHDPRMIVCDEPTSALDAQTGQTVMEILRDIALEASRAVLVVTHDSRIFDFADRIVHMVDGRISKEERNGGADESRKAV